MDTLPLPQEPLKNIQELESSHTHLQHERRQPPPQQHPLPWQSEDGCGGLEPPEFNFTEEHYLSVLESMGQAVHIYDQEFFLIYWNRSAEILYGYSAAEALGCHVVYLLTDVRDHEAGFTVVTRVRDGETWTGQFPVRHKLGKKFLAITTASPFCDDRGVQVGIVTVTCDTTPFEGIWSASKTVSKRSWTDSVFARCSDTFGLEPHQPLQVAVASRISNLASKLGNKMKSKLRKGEHVMDESQNRDCPDNSFPNESSPDNMEDYDSSGASTPRDDIPSSSFGLFHEVREVENPNMPSSSSGCVTERKPRFHKTIASKAEAWIQTKGILWPWKGSEDEGVDVKTTFFGSPSTHNDHDNVTVECSRANNNEAPQSGLRAWSLSVSANRPGKEVATDNDDLDQEMLWEDLKLGYRIGQGSCGTVYHATWFGSDVAVKAFSKKDFSEEVMISFRQEVSLMKRLRHPNVLVFMGAVSSPQRLCVITEFLPRGSLFHLIQRNVSKLDWRQRTLVALDIAQGMDYLHSYNPPIVHRDLKSSNLLVDKDWTVKVGDFCLSSLKNETFLTTKNRNGTPQWMAPEVLRNERADEKSDVYSFGVILWELATERIPWHNLTEMQVIGLVGFLNRRLEIPEDVDPLWASVIESCWREPKNRPTFGELLEELKGMLKKYPVQFQATCSA